MTLDWQSGYKEDGENSRIINALQVSEGKTFPSEIINSMVMEYQQYLKQHLIIMGDKLVLFKTVNMDSKLIPLLITSESLRHKLSSLSYSTIERSYGRIQDHMSVESKGFLIQNTWGSKILGQMMRTLCIVKWLAHTYKYIKIFLASNLPFLNNTRGLVVFWSSWWRSR